MQKLRRFPLGQRSISPKSKPHRLKCNTGNFQCGARCLPIQYNSKRTGAKAYTNCRKNATGMAKSGLEWITNQAQRIEAVNQHRTAKSKASLYLDPDAKFQIKKAEASKYTPKTVVQPLTTKKSKTPRKSKAKLLGNPIHSKITTIEEAIANGEAIAGEWLKKLKEINPDEEKRLDLAMVKQLIKGVVFEIGNAHPVHRSAIRLSRAIKKRNPEAMNEAYKRGGSQEQRKVSDKLLEEYTRSRHPEKFIELDKQVEAIQGKIDLGLQMGKQLIDHLLKTSTLSKTQSKNIVENILVIPGASLKQLKPNLIEALQITNGIGLSDLKRIALGDGVIDHRSKASQSNNAILMAQRKPVLSSSQILDDTFKSTLFHELGHFAEYHTNINASPDFLKKRAIAPLSPLGEGYRDDEVHYPDKFLSPYTGKYYDNKTTEIISMGLQEFSSPERLVNFATKDPEHFLFTLGYIRQTGHTSIPIEMEKYGDKTSKATLYKSTQKLAQKFKTNNRKLKITHSETKPTGIDKQTYKTFVTFSSPSDKEGKNKDGLLVLHGGFRGRIEDLPSYQVAKFLYSKFPEILTEPKDIDTRMAYLDKKQNITNTINAVKAMEIASDDPLASPYQGNILDDLFNGDIDAMIGELGNFTYADWERVNDKHKQSRRYATYLSQQKNT